MSSGTSGGQSALSVFMACSCSSECLSFRLRLLEILLPAFLLPCWAPGVRGAEAALAGLRDV